MHAAGLAISTYRKHPRDFEGLQRRGMARDSSWDGAARTYEEVFTWAHGEAGRGAAAWGGGFGGMVWWGPRLYCTEGGARGE